MRYTALLTILIMVCVLIGSVLTYLFKPRVIIVEVERPVPFIQEALPNYEPIPDVSSNMTPSYLDPPIGDVEIGIGNWSNQPYY